MLRVTLLLILLLTGAVGSAGVVSRDLFEPGDGLLTYDDVNQREWLDFSVTTGLPFHDLNLLLGSDRRLFGFTVALGSDVQSLVDSAYQESDLVALLGEYPDPRLDTAQTAAATYTGGKIGPVALSPLAILAIADFDSNKHQLYVVTRSGFATQSGTADLLSVSEFDEALPNYWLYRDAVAVPEPTAACLALTACLAAWRLRGLA